MYVRRLCFYVYVYARYACMCVRYVCVYIIYVRACNGFLSFNCVGLCARTRVCYVMRVSYVCMQGLYVCMYVRYVCMYVFVCVLCFGVHYVRASCIYI